MQRNGNVSKVPLPVFSLQTEPECGNRCRKARSARAERLRLRGRGGSCGVWM